MSRIIAGIYEIQEEIGAGGGGIVYLGRHLRLDKKVVLKADKRTLSTEMETLRREVDMLKGLSHTHIPQVYDFVQEDGVVYTVMDFIAGKSLDRMLGAGQLPTQPQVIRWACQLLDALKYLHEQPPYGILHGDIKPANIMLRPDGDVCLIDFNIALALGEDGAVKVGFSRGYASPEHYGADYIRSNRQAAVGQISDIGTAGKSKRGGDRITVGEETMVVEDRDRTAMLISHSPDGGQKADSLIGSRDGAELSAGSTTGGKRAILLDVRSDIYSLGATLYHLLSGYRPAENAIEVEPLGADICSPAVSAIIQKAMAPEPDMRYQSAAEMRRAFLELSRRDPRMIRHKRRMAASAAILFLFFLAGGMSTFVGLKRMEQMQAALALAEYSANSLAEGNVSEAIEQALDAIPDGEGLLHAPVTPQAQKALTDALGVYDLADGFKTFGIINLPGTPFALAVSPEGSYFAVVYAYEVTVFETKSRQKVISLPILESAMSELIFLDETHVLYAGKEGVTAYDLDKKSVQWTGESAAVLALSGDGCMAAAVKRDGSGAILYRVSDGFRIAEISFGEMRMPMAYNDIFTNPKDTVFSLNEDGSLLAVSFEDGSLVFYSVKESENVWIVREKSEYKHFEGGFYDKYFAYTAWKSGGALFELVDTKELVSVGGYESRNRMFLHVSGRGILLAEGNLLVQVEPETLKEIELAYSDNASVTAFSAGDEYVLAALDNEYAAFYDSAAGLSSIEYCSEGCDFVAMAGDYAILANRNEPSVRLFRLEKHAGNQYLRYDARYAHEEARISRDGTRAMLFNYQRFRIYDMEGNIVAEKELPDTERIYDQQFEKNEDASWLKVIWYDGTVRHYSAADGSLLSEEKGEKPSKDLKEEFYTEKYRIVSSLHTAPEAYELGSNKLAGRLEEDAYLTYVTQVGEYIITEYVNAEGERYGFLLDENLGKLAYLPGISDVTEDGMIFDDKSGNLRQCRIYSLQELIRLGETILQNEERRVS